MEAFHSPAIPVTPAVDELLLEDGPEEELVEDDALDELLALLEVLAELLAELLLPPEDADASELLEPPDESPPDVSSEPPHAARAVAVRIPIVSRVLLFMVTILSFTRIGEPVASS